METTTTRRIRNTATDSYNGGHCWVENTGADEGPIVEISRFIKRPKVGYVTVTERWVVSEAFGINQPDGSIRWHFSGVRLNNDGSLDIRSASPRGGLKTKLLPYSRTAKATGEIRIPEDGAWMRAY